MTVRMIASIDELNIPKKHKFFIERFLLNVRSMEHLDKIERLVLYGSCAREEATEKSDIDIAAIGEKIDDDTLYELYDCGCIIINDRYFLSNDIIVITNDLYQLYKNTYGMVQMCIERDGVDISGLL